MAASNGEIRAAADLILIAISRRIFSAKREVCESERPWPSSKGSHGQAKETSTKETRCCWLPEMFCWPCLFFSTDGHPRRSTGFSSLSTLSTASNKHQNSDTFDGYNYLKTFGDTRVDLQLDEQRKREGEEDTVSLTVWCFGVKEIAF